LSRPVESIYENYFGIFISVEMLNCLIVELKLNELTIQQINSSTLLVSEFLQLISEKSLFF